MLFRLALSTMIERKSFVLALFFVLTVPFALPYLTPWEETPVVIEPARAQAAWACLWLVTLGWLFYQGSDMGWRYSANGLFQYAKSLGVSKWSRLCQLWACGMIFLVAMVAIALAINVFFCRPHQADEARMWIITCFQYAGLFLLVTSPLLFLSIALGSRFNSAAAYCFVLGISVYGLFALPYVELYLQHATAPLLSLFWYLSPHYHIADLTSRLVFRMGPMDMTAMGMMTLYFLGLGLVTWSCSYLMFKEQK